MSDGFIPTPQELASTFKLFSLLGEDGCARLLKAASRRGVTPGEVICREGDRGGELYVIVRGKVTVTADDLGKPKHVADLGPGGIFGEMATVAHQPRAATVVAIEASELLVFAAPAVETVLHDYPKVRQTLGHLGLVRTEELLQKLSDD